MYNCIHLLCSEIKETLQKAYPDSKASSKDQEYNERFVLFTWSMVISPSFDFNYKFN